MAKYNDYKILTGEDLKKVRLIYKLKQKDMALFFGVARSTYAVWESQYKNKLLPINKYKDAFEAIEFWMPRKLEEEKKKISLWSIVKWKIKEIFCKK